MTRREIQRKLEEINDIFNSLSSEPEFTKIAKDSENFSEIPLTQSWQGVEETLEMINVTKGK